MSVNVVLIYTAVALVCFVSSITVICSSEMSEDTKIGCSFVAAVFSSLWMIAIPCAMVSLITYLIMKKVKNAWWWKNV